MWEMFRNCGWAAPASLLVGILATLFGVVAIAFAFIKPRVGVLLGFVALAMSCSPAGIGALGMFHGKQLTDSAVSGESINPDLRERVRQEGYKEAEACVPVGATIGVLPLIVSGVAIALAMGRKKQANA